MKSAANAQPQGCSKGLIKRLHKGLWLIVGLAIIASSARAQTASPCEAYLQSLRAGLTQSRNQIPLMTASAEEAARRITEGGKLWVTGSQGDFAHEAVERASGLMGIRVLAKSKVKPDDVVLIGARGKLSKDDLSEIAELRRAGVYVAVFASDQEHVADAIIDCGSQGAPANVSTDTTLNLVNLWTWTGEFASACTRLGKCPTFYISYWLPGGREWAARYRDQMFHADLRVNAVSPGALGNQYLDHIDAILEGIAQQHEKLEQAARWIEKTPAGKRELAVMAHLYPEHFRDPRDPKVFEKFERWEKDESQNPPPTLLLGYQFAPENLIAHLKPGQKLIYTTVQQSRQATLPDVLYIDPRWPLEDGCCHIPGYPHPILPASAIAQSAIYRSIAAEILATQPHSGR